MGTAGRGRSDGSDFAVEGRLGEHGGPDGPVPPVAQQPVEQVTNFIVKGQDTAARRARTDEESAVSASFLLGRVRDGGPGVLAANYANCAN